MSAFIDRPDMTGVLSSLKDFQRQTVEYVFRRMYLDGDCTRRFLVADEVGLGKTMVARGVIGKAIEHLWDTVQRIDVIYICSNSDIARQNINRLRLDVPGEAKFARASRVTLLPITLHELNDRRVNFVSFTPTTSFDLKSNLGIMQERALLYWLLQEAWGTEGTGPLNVLRGNAGSDGFRALVKGFKNEHTIDAKLTKELSSALKQQGIAARKRGERDLRSRFEELCEEFRNGSKQLRGERAAERSRLVGELRSTLATTCLRALEPDLVILDEFQRFKHLLTGEGEAGELARELFEYSDEHSAARVLLLSATPYKMYTLAEESSEDDHYEDFIATLSFLRDGEVGRARQLLDEFRRELYHVRGRALDLDRLATLKQCLEAELRGVMVRTERLAVSEDRDGMLVQVVPDKVRLEVGDLTAYLDLTRVAKLVGGAEVLSYWKAAPYLLNFMDEYELKRGFLEGIEDAQQAPALAKLLADAEHTLLRWEDVQAYGRVDPGNARLRALFADTVDAGAWKLLWVPPSLPYYEPEGPFREPVAQGLTKRLVFSTWQVVPKVIAALVSYEAERRMILSYETRPENTVEARKARRGLLRFARAEGRLTGMPVLGLIYPSRTLARACDPLTYVLSCSTPPRLEDVITWATGQIEPLLAPLVEGALTGGAEDESWYWAAPILLDVAQHPGLTQAWFSRKELPEQWTGEEPGEGDEDSSWAEHVKYAREAAEKQRAFGAVPKDLARRLAELAIAGPAICALRALWRAAGPRSRAPEADTAMCDSAAQIAWRFRALFNLPEVTCLLRGMNGKEPYWQRVVDYCAWGGLQAVIDELAHVTLESAGLLGKPPEEAAEGIAEAIVTALGIRVSSLGVDTISASTRRVKVDKSTMRARFALRFGDERNEETKEVTRAGQVRSAFNSPFWPFVLATTSVGQEGLDFHPYAHAVVHWDLPSNPVDLEQREGRVHRYKGHAVRKNLAHRYGLEAVLPSGRDVALDPWRSLFVAAVGDRPSETTDLVPFWVYPLEGGAQIERHVPVLPLSRDAERLGALRRSLVMYRMVFGQPRQEDLLEYLTKHLPEEEVPQVVERLRLDLGPPRVG
jgi:hypothetical protein